MEKVINFGAVKTNMAEAKEKREENIIEGKAETERELKRNGIDLDGEEYENSVADLAKENYARAYKRIQIIITFLHGEEPEDVNLTTQNE